MKILLYLAFVLSGAAGLIYESIWTRYLGLFVGHSAYAQIIVLSIFLGGMSAGAMIIGQRSQRLREPLVWYAAVELIVGLIGLAFHDVYVGVTGYAYDSLFPALAGGTMLTLVKWTIAGLLILPQSVLLGMTFPLMSAGVIRLAGKRPGRVLSLLYFSNSLGAAIGVLLAGFYLIAISGLPGTLLAAAIVNIVVALAVFIGVRLTGTTTPVHDSRITPDSPFPSLFPIPQSLVPSTLWRLLLVLSFGTAVASFIYEIAWIRMLSQVLGSATHSFELMLSAFILGLALGALWVHRRADRFRDPIRALGIVQALMGLAALSTLPVYLQSFSWTAKLLSTLGPTNEGYTAFTFARYAFCLAVMLPSTFFAGITLPLITRVLLVSRKADGERAIGMVYGVNTLGSIVGVILAGLILMPVVGLKNLLITGAMLDITLGVILLRVAAGSSAPARRFAYGTAAVMAVVAVIAIFGIQFDRVVLSSGVYRYASIPQPGSRKMLFYKDGRTATVSVARSKGEGTVYISTNGKPDASLDTSWFRKPGDDGPRRPMGGDVSTQVLLPMIVLAHRPDAKQVAVIGHGSGMTSHFLLGSSALRQLVTIEIEPRMIDGSRAFYPVNRRVFDDKRSRFVIDDAKSFFAASSERYDIILSEPSNPWVSGVSGLFTTEFYSRVRRYLSDDGVFGQWLHLYEINDGLVLSVLAAIHQNFPSYQVYMTSIGDMLIVASNRKVLPRPDWSVFALPEVDRDLRHAILFTPRMLDATRSLPRAALAPVLDKWGQPNSDFYPILDLGTERTRFRKTFADGFASLTADRFDIVAPFFDMRSPFATNAAAPIPNLARMQSLAISGALHDFKPGDAADSGASPVVAAALQRRWRLEGTLRSDLPPADWRLWVTDVMSVERDLHGGTAGVVDEKFYASLQRFTDRHDAPAGARTALTFLHALASWDFPTASRAADSLLQPAAEGKTWIPVDDFRSGALVAKLRVGDVAGARKIYTTLAPRTRRSRDDLRERLLFAYLTESENRLRLRVGRR